MLVYKSVNNDCPTYINELFKLKIVKYNLRGIGDLSNQTLILNGYIGHFRTLLVLSGTIYLFKWESQKILNLSKTL